MIGGWPENGPYGSGFMRAARRPKPRPKVAGMPGLRGPFIGEVGVSGSRGTPVDKAPPGDVNARAGSGGGTRGRGVKGAVGLLAGIFERPSGASFSVGGIERVSGCIGGAAALLAFRVCHDRSKSVCFAPE